MTHDVSEETCAPVSGHAILDTQFKAICQDLQHIVRSIHPVLTLSFTLTFELIPLQKTSVLGWGSVSIGVHTAQLTTKTCV